jgi:hypothetical protein
MMMKTNLEMYDDENNLNKRHYHSESGFGFRVRSHFGSSFNTRET